MPVVSGLVPRAHRKLNGAPLLTRRSIRRTPASCASRPRQAAPPLAELRLVLRDDYLPSSLLRHAAAEFLHRPAKRQQLCSIHRSSAPPLAERQPSAARLRRVRWNARLACCFHVVRDSGFSASRQSILEKRASVARSDARHHLLDSCASAELGVDVLTPIVGYV